MRTWRVGTISMGLSLLLLGIILLTSQWLDFNLTKVMVAWWPAILIVLGLEILVYLFLSGKEKPFLKYDVLSIFLVGLLGTVGIGFAILSATGIVEKAAEFLDRKEQSYDLPDYSKGLPETVKRVVIQAEQLPLTIEGNIGNEIAVFGTYRAVSSGEEPLLKKPTDYLAFHEKGDTLYIKIKKLPEELGPFAARGDISATIVVPDDLELEVFGHGNSITMKPRILVGNWTVEDASNVSLYVQDGSDVLVTAVGVKEFEGQADIWEVGEANNKNSSRQPANETSASKRTYQTGKGIHHLQVLNAYSVSLNPVK